MTPELSSRERLLLDGRNSISALRQGLKREQTFNEIKALHLKAACWDVMAVPETKILAMSQTSLSTGLAEYEPPEEMATRLTTWGIAAVKNMAIKKLSDADARKLQQVIKPHQ